MILLVLFAFLAGIITVLSPCILPILPIILSSSVNTTGKRRPLGVVIGFVLSFTFFTLFLSTIVKLSGIPAESLRFVSIFILTIFGLSLFVPKLQLVMEQLFSKLTNLAPQGQTKHGFFGGLIIGLSLGLLWTPCVGPILASVISLALSGAVTTQAFVITFSYSLGTAIPMFIVMQAGSTALRNMPWLLQNSGKIQKAFGVFMIITAIGIFFNVDRRFQTYILATFPNYAVGLTKFEDNEAVRNQLKTMNAGDINKGNIGRPMFDLTIPVEYHAYFAIFTHGTFRVFTAPMYHNLSPEVFIQAESPNTVRVQKTGVTWDDFFKTLPFSVTKDCLTTGTQQVFCTGKNGTLSFYLNGIKDEHALDQMIKDGDRLLITFGNESEDVIKKQINMIPR